jgi:hypothetical protein
MEGKTVATPPAITATITIVKAFTILISYGLYLNDMQGSCKYKWLFL